MRAQRAPDWWCFGTVHYQTLSVILLALNLQNLGLYFVSMDQYIETLNNQNSASNCRLPKRNHTCYFVIMMLRLTLKICWSWMHDNTQSLYPKKSSPLAWNRWTHAICHKTSDITKGYGHDILSLICAYTLTNLRPPKVFITVQEQVMPA